MNANGAGPAKPSESGPATSSEPESVSLGGNLRRIVADAVRIDPAGVHVRFGLRCAAGVAIVLGAGLWAGQPRAGAAAAVGAFIVGFASRQGVYRTRAGAMLLTGSAMSLSAFAASATGGIGWANVLVAMALGIAAGVLASLGTVATTIGLNALVAFALFTQFHDTPEQALTLAVLVFSGGAFQTLLMVAVWPLSRFRAERDVLAKAYRELAAYAGALPRRSLRSPAPDAFTELRTTLADPQPFARRGEIMAFETLLIEAERVRATLGALALDGFTLARAERHDAVRELDALADNAGKLLQRIAEALEAATKPDDWDDTWDALDARLGRVELLAPQQTARDARALLGQLRAAWRAAESPGGELGGTARVPVENAHGTRIADALDTLRANCSPRSAYAQHGIRLAAVIAAAHLASLELPLQRGYWIMMTAVLVLRPDFATTFTRGVARLGGTLTGALVAGLVGLTHPGQTGDFICALAFATVAFIVFNANYAIFTTAVTGYVVFLLAFGGAAQHAALADRIVETLLGGAFALAAYAFFPTWERAHVPQRLAELLGTQRDYGSHVLDAYLGVSYDGDAARRAQLASWRARSNAEASVDRMLAEPVAPKAVTARAALGILAASRRYGLALLALQSRIGEDVAPIPQARPLISAFAEALDRIVAGIRGRRDPEPLPPLRDLHAAFAAQLGEGAPPPARAFVSETDLMVDSLNAIVDVLHRLHTARDGEAPAEVRRVTGERT